jgi:hypothetical protein
MTKTPTPKHVNQLLSEETKELFTYWCSLHTSGRPPSKSSVNPYYLRKILRYLVIYERTEERLFWFRLIGTNVVELLGGDFTGKNLTDVPHYAAKEKACDDLNRIVDEPCGQVLVVKNRFESGREFWIEMLRLPLTDDDGNRRYVIGCAAVKKTTGIKADGMDKPVLVAQRIKGFFCDLQGHVRGDTIWTETDELAPPEVGRAW